ncbi:hypothetical protein QL285_033519 [Trifolium repens]|nr:hypothetical protein QL285_033519 [Trifolium repens]
MSVLWWESGGGAWAWRRPLWAWEEELLGECRNLFYNLVLQPHVADQWRWRYDPEGGYTVRGAYTLLARTEVPEEVATTTLIWHKQVPLKVSVLAWRVLRNRLPTRDNLVRRHIIEPNTHFCVTGCGGEETAQHLFLSCPVFAPLWGQIRSWVGFSSVDPVSIPDHFVQFSHSAGGSRARRSFLQLLWLCSIWVIWHERNSIIFKAKESTVLQMLEKVKVNSLWWMKTCNMNIGVNSHLWWSSPFMCLGIG